MSRFATIGGATRHGGCSPIRGSMAAAEPSSAMKARARLVFLAGVAMNAHKRVHDGARKELFATLLKNGIGAFSFETKDQQGKKLRLEVAVSTPQRESIDVALLRSLVDDGTFMRIVQATKKAVEDEAGKAIEVQATIVGEGTQNVFVTAAK